MKIPAILFVAIFCFASIASAAKTVAGYPASTSLELFKKAGSYITQKDNEALNKLLASGQVIMLKGGIEVEIVKYNMLTGIAKIRAKGETLEFWTNVEAVKQ